jgi:F-type H+-transporting ATPase subunit b
MRPGPIRGFVLVVALSAMPAAALAATGGEGGGNFRAVWDLIWRVVNFAALVGVLVYFARKPVADGIRNSIESVRKLLQETEESRKEAEAKMQEAEQRLARVDKEVEDLLVTARQESEVEKERILAEAEEAVQRLKREAKTSIELELKKSQDLLRREVAESAVAAAEEIIRQNIKPEDQRRFINEYLEKLEANTT